MADAAVEADVARQLARIEQEIDVLKRQMVSLRAQQQQQGEWLDTVNSPWYRRVRWFVQGYRYHRLGRWYDVERPW